LARSKRARHRTKKRRPSSTYTSAIEFIARRRVQLGEREAALRLLRRGYEQHTFMLPFINAAPAYDSLRTDPRFMEIVRQIGLTQ